MEEKKRVGAGLGVILEKIGPPSHEAPEGQRKILLGMRHPDPRAQNQNCSQL